MSEQYQITEYTQTAAALAMLREKHCGPFDVTTTKGMIIAKEARAEVRGYRVMLEKVRVEIKAPALERSRLIDAEAKRITTELLAIEEPIDRAIKEEEARKEEEKAAKARTEAARLAVIAGRINSIKTWAGSVAFKTAEDIKAELEKALALELAPEEFQEFMPDALEALAETRKDLAAALNARLLYEAEQARIKAEQAAEAARIQAEREELAKLREQETARQVEQARIAEETRKVEAARLQAERQAQEAELKAQREEQERQEREGRQARQAEESRLQAEREAIEQERKALDARQAEEAKAAQKAKSGTKRNGSKQKDPVADLKQALNANPETAKALDEAYRRGFNAGLDCTQHAS